GVAAFGAAVNKQFPSPYEGMGHSITGALPLMMPRLLFPSPYEGMGHSIDEFMDADFFDLMFPSPYEGMGHSIKPRQMKKKQPYSFRPLTRVWGIQ
ncbi:hypothetical protein, partial [Streptococcus sobrinus]|uniref:hypothetical protein n=1 Tax=Streptococcus sobrinus TaxID=1310 RepID=UPI003F64AA80